MASSESQSWTQQPGGDVSIALGAGHNYLLKSESLRKHSSFFAGLLNEEHTEVPESRSKDTRRIRWKIELVERPSPGDKGAGVLELLSINEKGQTLPGGRRCPTDPQNGGVPNPVYRHYHRVLGSLYGERFKVDSAEDISVTVNDVLGLMEVSEYLDCVSTIATTIVTGWLGKGVALYKNIAGSPCGWALLGARVRCELIFREAVIHIVGRWQDPSLAGKAFLPNDVSELCQHKHKQLLEFKKTVEQRLVNYYPKEMKRDPNDIPASYNRTAYSSDIFTWMASTCFKQWLASVIVRDMHRHGPDGGYWLYSKVNAGGHSYITEAEMVDFYKVFPLSQKGRAVFQEKMLDIKYDVKAIVRPLLRNESELDAKELGFKYLTCCKVDKQDYPWVSTEPASNDNATGTKRGYDTVDHEGEATTSPAKRRATVPILEQPEDMED